LCTGISKLSTLQKQSHPFRIQSCNDLSIVFIYSIKRRYMYWFSDFEEAIEWYWVCSPELGIYRHRTRLSV